MLLEWCSNRCGDMDALWEQTEKPVGVKMACGSEQKPVGVNVACGSGVGLPHESKFYLISYNILKYT